MCSELVGESVLSIQSSEKVTSISLPPTPPYHTLEFKLEVLCVIPSGADQSNSERLTNGEVRHRPRSYSHPDTPMTAIDQRVGVSLNSKYRFEEALELNKLVIEFCVGDVSRSQHKNDLLNLPELSSRLSAVISDELQLFELTFKPMECVMFANLKC